MADDCGRGGGGDKSWSRRAASVNFTSGYRGIMTVWNVLFSTDLLQKTSILLTFGINLIPPFFLATSAFSNCLFYKKEVLAITRKFIWQLKGRISPDIGVSLNRYQTIYSMYVLFVIIWISLFLSKSLSVWLSGAFSSRGIIWIPCRSMLCFRLDVLIYVIRHHFWPQNGEWGKYTSSLSICIAKPGIMICFICIHGMTIFGQPA